MGQYYNGVILTQDKKDVKQFVSTNGFKKLTEHSYISNDFVRKFESLIYRKPENVVWAGDYGDKDENNLNFYDKCVDSLRVKNLKKIPLVSTRFIINHDKKQFVDKTKVPNFDGWKMHPLPILTASGNGRGGGDYYSKNGAEFVGVWCGDLIEVNSFVPTDYIEINPDFIEN